MSIIKKIALPLLLFAAAQTLMGVYRGFYDPSFNNYLSQVHNLDALARGGLEFTREFPGFLTVLIFASLAFLPDTRIAMLAVILVGVSLLGQGHLAPNMKWVVVWMVTWSAGDHLFLVLKSSVALRMASENSAGALLGNLGALESLGNLFGMICVYLGVSFLSFNFANIFTIAGICAIVAGVLLFIIKPEPITASARSLVFKKKYIWYYLLNILFGARKQIFLTFAPWILIKLYSSGVSTFALLGIAGAVISMLFRPLLGKAIDKWGEKKIIFCESASLIAICAVYGAAPQWAPVRLAVPVIMVCYILDQMLFAVNIARSTYLKKIAVSSEDVASTISMGVTLDHAVSMTIPFFGGLLWVYYGYQWVFWAAAVIALLNLIVSLFMDSKLN
ncbi:MAG: MFS transporter [Syntrophomonadaceae bacterium]|jgi:hypothetical protein|nr:MFS transporter [Syntrophomonadaceae bacterium]